MQLPPILVLEWLHPVTFESLHCILHNQSLLKDVSVLQRAGTLSICAVVSVGEDGLLNKCSGSVRHFADSDRKNNLLRQVGI